jgi:hypothetical protein
MAQCYIFGKKCNNGSTYRGTMFRSMFSGFFLVNGTVKQTFVAIVFAMATKVINSYFCVVSSK